MAGADLTGQITRFHAYLSMTIFCLQYLKVLPLDFAIECMAVCEV